MAVSASTQPDSSSALTSPFASTSPSPRKPWVTLPTLQFAWSAATVEKVRLADLTQKTQPAGTRPVRPSSAGVGHGIVEGGDAVGRAAVEGDRERRVGQAERALELPGEVGPVSRGGHSQGLLPWRRPHPRPVRGIEAPHAVREGCYASAE